MHVYFGILELYKYLIFPSNHAANYMAMSGSLTEGTLDATKYNRVHALANSNR